MEITDIIASATNKKILQKYYANIKNIKHCRNKLKIKEK